MGDLRSDLLVQVSVYNPFKKQNRISLGFFLRHAVMPARWWCPDYCHIRLPPFVLHIPRRWWSHKEDGAKRRCVNCGRRVWRVDGVAGSMMWCDSCKLLERQLRAFFDAPSWWIQSIKRTSKERDWFKA